MLLDFIPELKNSKIIALINKFYYSYIYVALIAVLMVLAEIFSIEIAVYYIAGFFGVLLPCLLSEDSTPMIPPVIFLYISASLKTMEKDPTLLFTTNVEHAYKIVPLVCIPFAARLIYDIVSKKERRKFPRLLIGYAAMAIPLLIGGVFSPYFQAKSVLFGFSVIGSLVGTYIFFLYTVNWQKFKKDYFAWALLFYGIGIAIEIIYFLTTREGDVPLFVGWGCRNDVGGQMAICVAAPIYLAVRRKHSWLYTLLSIALLIAAGLTNSRGGAFTALFVSFVGFVIAIIKGNKWQKIQIASVCGVFAVVSLVLYLTEQSFVMKYFGRLFTDINGDWDAYSSHRITIWKYGLNQWKEYPIFGVGYLECKVTYFVYNARYHNTIVQLMASTGLVGLLTYLFHRFETVLMTFKKPTLNKTYAFICLMGLCISSLVDCYMFNIWPGMIYGFLLAYIEGMNKQIENS